MEVANCVTPARGVVLKDTVGSAPVPADVVGELTPPAVGSAKVGSETGVLVEATVGEGAASAVCVN